MHVAGRHEPLRQQRLDRLQHGDQRPLVVERTAPVHESVGDVAAEGIPLPALVRDGDDVVVGHQHDRLLAAAAPDEMERTGADDLRLELLVDQGVQLGEHPPERREGRVVPGRRVGHGRDADQRREPLGGAHAARVPRGNAAAGTTSSTSAPTIAVPPQTAQTVRYPA